MKSAQPKVLHPVTGRSLIEHVLATAAALKPQNTGVVVGVGRQQVQQTLQNKGWKKLTFIVQDQPRGSGHAVLKARNWLRHKKGTLLVLYGDTPLLTPETLQHLIETHAGSGHAASFLAMDLPDPAGYGRMILDGNGGLERIIEYRDANETERQVTLVNSGVACWDIPRLLEVLPELRPDNAKHEYYLTDAVALLRAREHSVGVVTATDPTETHGVNDRNDLADVEAISRRRILQRWMQEGVTVVDPATTYVDANVVLQPDTRLWPGTILQGSCRIGPRCEIGPYTLIESSVAKAGARIGPFAHVRPGSVIEAGAHIGNFVEVKKSRIGKGSKANHLSYLGDARVGDRVNVGAGTITCNYDGVAKHATMIADDVFIGSNANLVAPVRIGRGAMIAAGSTITDPVPPDSLAVARTPQVVKRRWVKAWLRTRKRGAR